MKYSKFLDGYELAKKIDFQLKMKILMIFVFRDIETNDKQLKNNILFKTEDDKVYGMGANNNGVLGLGHDREVSNTEVIIELCQLEICEFIEGYDFMAARTLNQRVLVWGRNHRGQLGIGFSTKNTTKKYYKPDFLELNSIIKVSCGFDHSMALDSGGVIHIWGQNNHGLLGFVKNDHLIHSIKLPNNQNCKDIKAGNQTSFALTDDGKVYGWGKNHNGILGQGDKCNVKSPTKIKHGKFAKKIVEKVIGNNLNSYFLTNDHEVYYCGKSFDQYQCQLVPKKLEHKAFGSQFQDIYCPSYPEEPMDLLILGNCIYQIIDNYWLQKDKKYTNFVDYFKDMGITPETLILKSGNITTSVVSQTTEKKHQNPVFSLFRSLWSIVVPKKPAQNKKPKIRLDLSEKSIYNNEGKFEGNFSIIGELGAETGVFGTKLFIVADKNKRELALKKICCKELDEELREKAFQESRVHSGLNSKYIVQYEDSWIENQFDLFILMECCQDDLSNVLKNKSQAFQRTKKTDKINKIEYLLNCQMLSEITKGLAYLHSQMIIHRDMKPANILVSKKLGEIVLKICDFNLSVYHEWSQSHSKGVGSPRYLAPEINQTRDYTEKVDIYSLGMIAQDIFELDYNATDIGLERYRTAIDNQTLKYLGELILKMITFPFFNSRPDCRTILVIMNTISLPSDEVKGNLKNNWMETIRSLETFENSFFFEYFNQIIKNLSN